EGSDRALVARRCGGRRRGGACGVRRRLLPRPLHRHGRVAVQDLADGARTVVRGVLRLRQRRGARRLPVRLRTDRCGIARVADHRLRADPHRGVRDRRGRRGLGRLQCLPPSRGPSTGL
ncbi:MAG: hypothetical protein AVDCRST_MAG72-2152, partial [uncultured Nocardioidaceae bacterium]